MHYTAGVEVIKSAQQGGVYTADDNLCLPISLSLSQPANRSANKRAGGCIEYRGGGGGRVMSECTQLILSSTAVHHHHRYYPSASQMMMMMMMM